MRYKGILSAFLVLCMVFTSAIPSYARKQEDLVFQAGDIAIVVNDQTEAGAVMNPENPLSRLKDAELSFETGNGMYGEAEGEEGPEEDLEPGLGSLEQALAESETGYVDVISGMPFGEDGPKQIERIFRNDIVAEKQADGPAFLQAQQAASYQPGDVKVIHAGMVDNSRKDVTVKCITVGEHCTIWCETDSEYPELTMSLSHAQQYAKEFDGKWDEFVSCFGDYRSYPNDEAGTMDIDGDGKLAILCYDMNVVHDKEKRVDGRIKFPGSYMAGYFSPIDFMPSEARSNQMDCIHMDTVCSMSVLEEDFSIIPDEAHVFGDVLRRKEVLFHELQHLTECAVTNCNSLPMYLDEAFSCAAMHLLYGPGAAYLDLFNDYAYGCPLTMWCYYDEPFACLNNYATSDLFSQYLRTRYSQEGKSSIKSGAAMGGDVYQAVLRAYCDRLAQAGYDADDSKLSAEALRDVYGVPLEELIRDFWCAVCVQAPNGKFSFSADGISPEEWSKEIKPQFITELPNGKAAIYNGSTKFYKITEDGTRLDALSVKNAAVIRLSSKDSYTVEFKLASPSDAERSKQDYETVKLVTVAKGSTAEKPETPKPEDYGISGEEYEFYGWFTEEDLEIPYDFSTPVLTDQVLYASWVRKTEKKPILVEFDANAPEEAIVWGSMPPQEATAFTPFALNKNGLYMSYNWMIYIFEGWGTTPNREDPDFRFYDDEENVVFRENTKLYAQWCREKAVAVWFDANGGDPDTHMIADEGDVIHDIMVEDPVREGYTFCGWWYMEGEEYTRQFILNTERVYEDQHLYARWKKNATPEADTSSGQESRRVVKPDPAVTPVTASANGNQLLGNAVISIKLANLTAKEKESLVTEGSWSKDAYGYWSLTDKDGKEYKSCWVLVSDALSSKPVGNASWYYFGADGKMVTGWQWIKAADGKQYCYYFNKEDGSMYGGCVLGGTTIDQYSVNEKGRWTDAAGKEQIR